MADIYSNCLLTAMDQLWFHQIILFQHPISLLIPPKTLNNYHICPSSTSSLSLSTLPNEETSSSTISSSLTLEEEEEEEENSPPITPMDDSSNNEDEKKEMSITKRLKLIKSRSHSSSPSTQIHRFLGSSRKLEKSMSCRGFEDLELEEVKGFIDLGFVFNKENLSPRMMSVLPGLQRLELIDISEVITKDDDDDDDARKHEEEKRSIRRPYLSEAWLIKRPDSPLLNLKVPKISRAADMKKHLKFWARTVASEIQQES